MKVLPYQDWRRILLQNLSYMIGFGRVQAVLVRRIGWLRINTAIKTDERVRLESEAINGALAMKMLGWEDPFNDALKKIRHQEQHYLLHMSRIRALNMALQFLITPLVAFITFSTYRALNGTLDVPRVFYALALLHLPKLFMILFFVSGECD